MKKRFSPDKTTYYHMQTFITWYPNFRTEDQLSFSKEESRQEDQELNDRLRLKVFEKIGIWMTNNPASDLIKALER